jgi:hypothetical protein
MSCLVPASSNRSSSYRIVQGPSVASKQTKPSKAYGSVQQVPYVLNTQHQRLIDVAAARMQAVSGFHHLHGRVPREEGQQVLQRSRR